MPTKKTQDLFEREVTVKGRHLLAAAAILVTAFVGTMRLFEFVWRRDALGDVLRQPGGWMGAVAVVAVSAVVHEGLHGLAWRTAARVPWRSIAVRPTWRGLGFVARANVPMPARAYRAGMVLPAVVMGIMPVVLGSFAAVGLVVVWGLFFLFECFPDIAVLLAMRKVPAGAWVRDHPMELGCRVVAGADALPTSA